MLIATSDRRETHEWSRIGGGVFSYQVRSALSGAADINHDGQIEYSEVAAFVDAANADLPATGKRISTFAWPPPRNRKAPLFSLHNGRGLRRLIVSTPDAGRLFLETETGEPWAGFHPAAGDRVTVYLHADEEMFLDDGVREVEIPAGPEDLWIREPLETERSLTRRGAADRALERGLFAIPFDRAYYRGYISGRPQLLPVEFAHSEIEARPPSATPRWAVGGGYIIGRSLLRRELDQGALVRVHLPILRGLSFSPGIEWALTSLQNGKDVHRVLLLPALSCRYEWRRIAGTGGIGIGWAVLAVTDGSADYTLGALRGGLGFEVRIVGNLWLALEGSYTGYLFTLDGREKLRTVPQGNALLVWR